VPIGKTAPDQLDELRMKAVEVRGVPGRTDGEGWGGCIWEGALGDARFDGGRVAVPQPLGPERMAALHEKLKDQHPETESVLLGEPEQLFYRLSLQLGGRVFGLTDRAVVDDRPLFVNLEGISIDQRHQGGWGDEHVAFIDIPHDVAAGM
jgi:hypothetical protein